MPIIAVEKYLKSEKIDSFEDLADLLAELPPFLKELYETGTKETRKKMRDIFFDVKSMKRKSDKIFKKVSISNRYKNRRCNGKSRNEICW